MFDCSFRPQNGTRSIHYMGHLKMMGAVQPFVSGAISKTINMPEECTVEDVMDAYIESWRHGPEGGGDLSRQLEEGPADEYRRGQDGREEDGCGGVRRPAKEVAAVTEKVVYRPVRRKLPDERQSITHKFSIGGHEGYITVGMYDDGTPGEIFVTMAKEGSTISGLMDSFATSVSYCLQYGVPLKFLVDKFGHVRFEPSGWTGNQQIPYAKSIPDYIFRWLAAKFLGAEYTTANEAGESTALRATEVSPQEIAAVPGGGDRCADVRGVRRHDDAQRELL